MNTQKPEIQKQTCGAISFRNGYVCALAPHEGITHTNKDGRWWREPEFKPQVVNFSNSPLSFRFDGRR